MMIVHSPKKGKSTGSSVALKYGEVTDTLPIYPAKSFGVL
jgi:hypothetical protein